MDDKNNKKTSSTPSFTASASNRNKNVNKMHVKVIKHYQPMMQTRPDSAVAELPDFGISDDDYNTKNSHGINSTDMRTTGLKCTIRAITKPNSNIQHDSAVNLLTNTKESKTKQTKRISLQCNYKQTGKKVAICSKVTKNLKNSATTPKPNKNVKTDSQSYVNELKDEINEFKSSQTSLTKAADNLKAEIKEFRDSLTNIHMSSAKISDLKDSNYDTKAIQTSYNDLMRAYGHLLDENKEKLQSSEIDEISWSYNNLPFPSLIVPSTSICNKDSIFNSIPNWMFDKKDKNLNFNKSTVLKDISIISAGKESLPESLSYSNEDFLFANDSIRTIDNIRESNLPQDINSSKLSYSKILQPKYVKFDCSKVQINEDDFNKGKLENDSPNSYRSERKVNKHIIDSRTGENEKEANHESDHSELKLPVVLQSIPSLNIEGVISSFYTDVENDFKEDSVNENQNENDRSTEDMDEYSTELDLEEDESRNEEVQNLKKRQAVILNEPGANMLLTYIPDEEKLKKRRKGNDEDDALKQLFLSMYGTVKTFPPTLQTETKIKLFNIITNAELEYLKCKERSSSDLSNSSNLSVPPSCTSSLLTSSTPLLTQCKIENIL